MTIMFALLWLNVYFFICYNYISVPASGCLRTDCSTRYLRCISNNLLRIFFLFATSQFLINNRPNWSNCSYLDDPMVLSTIHYQTEQNVQGLKLAAQKLDLASEISRPWCKALLGGHLVSVTHTALVLFKEWGSLQERWWETTLTWTIL